MYPHCTASLLFLSNTNIFQSPSPHSTTPISTFIVCNSVKICILHLLLKSSLCFLCAAGRQSWEKEELGIRRTEREFSALSFFIQNHTREECRRPSLQITEKSCLAEAEAYSLQGLSFTFALNADLTSAEKIFTRLITSTSLAETLYNNTSQLAQSSTIGHQIISFLIYHEHRKLFCPVSRKDGIMLAELFSPQQHPKSQIMKDTQHGKFQPK